MTGVDDIPETLRRPGYYGRFLPPDFVPEPPTLPPVGPCKECGWSLAEYADKGDGHDPACRLACKPLPRGLPERGIAPGAFDGTYAGAGTACDCTDKRGTKAAFGSGSPDA